MRYEDAATNPSLYEDECLRELRETLRRPAPGPERDHLQERGLTWLSVGYEGSFPETTILVTVEDLVREPSIIEYRFALWGPAFRSSNRSNGLPLAERELQADPRRVAADVWGWVLES